MHLSDFNTERLEIAVFCAECSSERWKRVVPPAIAVKWFAEETGEVVVVNLTKNAGANRYGNHPNIMPLECRDESEPHSHSQHLKYLFRGASELVKDLAFWADIPEADPQNIITELLRWSKKRKPKG